VRIVTAGMGLRVSKVLSYFRDIFPEVQFVGYYDPQPTHLDYLDTNIPKFISVETMLSDTRPDLFFVCLPNEFHLKQIRLGLEAGVRIFTKKPVVTSVEDTMQLAALLAKYGSERVMVDLGLNPDRPKTLAKVTDTL
jgi:predicted dehydrogenase